MKKYLSRDGGKSIDARLMEQSVKDNMLNEVINITLYSLVRLGWYLQGRAERVPDSRAC